MPDYSADFDDIVEAAKERRLVLFLGAGASRGALNSKKEPIPLGYDLKDRLAKKFLGDEYCDYDFNQVFDFACTKRDVKTVQRFVHEELIDFFPAEYHYIVPTLPWAAIFSTNYDLIIERAYSGTKGRLDNIKSIRDDDDSTDSVDNVVPYVKLHGCITHHEKVQPPLIASTDQIFDHSAGRAGQFSTFLEYALEKHIVFVGYGMKDANLRTLLKAVEEQAVNRPRHYIVRPDLRPIEEEYWEKKKFRPLRMGFEEFLTTLDSKISESERQLTLITLPAKTGLEKFIPKNDPDLSVRLRQYFSDVCTVLNKEIPLSDDDPQNFYDGFDTRWLACQQDLDFRRRVVDAVLNERIIGRVDNTENVRAAVIKSPAGEGKTVVLRRIAWEAAKKFDRLAIYVGQNTPIILSVFEEVFGLINCPLYLFVDDAADHSYELVQLIELAQRHAWPLNVVMAERNNEWNVQCQRLEEYVQKEYSFSKLSDDDILHLLSKLEEKNALGDLKSVSLDARIEKFRWARNLLVGMHEARRGQGFEQIIADEYEHISPDTAQVLYADICTLNRFNVPVRAGLIARVHEITYKDFQKEFFHPLEHVVLSREDRKVRDYVYEARHSYIANIVFENALPNDEARFESLSRLIGKLNPSFSYDKLAIVQILSADNLLKTFKERGLAEALYRAALDHLGDEVSLLHQQGIFLLKTADKTQKHRLKEAERTFLRALAIEPKNRLIAHSLAELDLKRSRLAETAEERVVWRKSAISAAKSLIKADERSFAHHTLVKALVDAVEENLNRLENEPENALLLESFSSSVRQVQSQITDSLQKHPNQSYILEAESKLYDILKNVDRSLSILERAYQASPESEFLARRLAKVYESKGDTNNQIIVLREAYANSPSMSKNIAFELAMALITSAPDASETKSNDILYYLDRSRSRNPNDRLLSQFWYARQLAIANRVDEARDVFVTLKSARLPLSARRKVRETSILRNADGREKRFYGTISRLSFSYGLIDAAGFGLPVYLAIEAHEKYTEDERLEFGIGFNFFGPVALRVIIS